MILSARLFSVGGRCCIALVLHVDAQIVRCVRTTMKTSIAETEHECPREHRHEPIGTEQNDVPC